MARRIALAVPARLEKATEASVSVPANIENLSTRGARVTTERSWKVNERLRLLSLGFGFRTPSGRVVYCEPLPNGQFAVGLQFDEPLLESMIGTGLKV